ncbi:hypothetical protein BGX21_006131 [Mortierella sp. AD011]|nr:hypothetical protein BGX21_006131 [Mortierella sp. AD011]
MPKDTEKKNASRVTKRTTRSETASSPDVKTNSPGLDVDDEELARKRTLNKKRSRSLARISEHAAKVSLPEDPKASRKSKPKHRNITSDLDQSRNSNTQNDYNRGGSGSSGQGNYGDGQRDYSPGYNNQWNYSNNQGNYDNQGTNQGNYSNQGNNNNNNNNQGSYNNNQGNYNNQSSYGHNNYGHNNYGQGNYGQGNNGQGNNGQGNNGQGNNGQGNYGQGNYGQGNYGPGNYGQGSYNNRQGSYGQGNYANYQGNPGNGQGGMPCNHDLYFKGFPLCLGDEAKKFNCQVCLGLAQPYTRCLSWKCNIPGPLPEVDCCPTVSAVRRNRAFFQNLSEGGKAAQTLPFASSTSASVDRKESESESDSSKLDSSEDEDDQEENSPRSGRRLSPAWTDEESQSDDQAAESDVDQESKSSEKKVAIKGECNRADHVAKTWKELDKAVKQEPKGKANKK